MPLYACRLLLVLPLLLFVLLLLFACANGRENQLSEGDAAPDFTLSDQSGEKHTLSSYRGHWVLLYFYPKNNTPGCTKQACTFRDQYMDFTTEGILVFGINPDSVASHRKFAEENRLKFPLLADEDKSVVKAYGVWGKFIKLVPLTGRWSFLIKPDGVIARIYSDVDPGKHPAQVLEDIKRLRSARSVSDE